MEVRLPRELLVIVFLAILLFPSFNVFTDQWANPAALEYVDFVIGRIIDIAGLVRG